MKRWLCVAADRGHELATGMVKKLESSPTQRTGGKEIASSITSEPESTSVLLKMQSKDLKNILISLEMNHINDFEVYSGNDGAQIEKTIQKRLSEGMDLDFITSNTPQSLSGKRDGSKLPLLHWAAWGGRVELLEALLKFGADINAIDPLQHGTPLAFALAAGEIEIAELLLQRGADAHKPNCFGRTAAHYLFMIPPAKFSTMVSPLKNTPKAISLDNTRPRQSRRLKVEDFFQHGETPLSFAAKYGHVGAVRAYLNDFPEDCTAEQFSRAIEYAVMNHQAAICDMILCKALQAFRTLANPFSSVAKGSLYTLMLFHGELRAEALDSTIKVLLSHRFDINSPDANEETAICLAVANDAHEQALASRSSYMVQT
jgi:ankyrin repeat protein